MKQKHRRMLWIAGIGSLMMASASVFFYQMQDHLIFFYTPSQLHQKPEAMNQEIRIGGLVKSGSVKANQDKTKFILTDQGAEIMVFYQGALPILFREGQGIVARGSFGDNKRFIAHELLAKHDENYMPDQLERSLEEQGYKQYKTP